jgi:CheY-like chemotaxis protein
MANIVIVEDSKQIIEYWQVVLARNDHSVVFTAKNPDEQKEALDMIGRKDLNVDVIIHGGDLGADREPIGSRMRKIMT